MSNNNKILPNRINFTIMASKDQNIFQLTFIKRSSAKRPKTSSINKSILNNFEIQKRYSENDPMMKMKLLKSQAKQAEEQYVSMLTSVKQSQKSISQNYREVQRKKVSFLKLYETKKLKNITHNLISDCKAQRLQHQSQTKDQVKKQKIEEQIKRLITQQEKQAQLQKLRKNIQSEKEELYCRKYIKTQQLFNTSRNSFLAIKRQRDESRQRKTQIQSFGNVRAKHNYWKRVGDEIEIMEEYEKLLKDLENYQNFGSDFIEPRAQTSQTARTSKTGFFLTQKK